MLRMMTATEIGFCIMAFMAATVLSAESVRASDSTYECRSADGRYVVSGGALEIRDGPEDQRSDAIDYRIVKEQMLTERKGYCGSSNRREYGFEFKRSVQVLAFRDNGKPVEAVVLCEISNSGLPAAYSCDRSVMTHVYEAKIANPAQRLTDDAARAAGMTASRWRLGQSEMILYAKGRQRVLVYAAPDGGASRAGAQAGDVAFRGQREGNIYTGEVFAFAAGCGVRGYYAEGRIGANQTTVTFMGETETFDRDCRMSAPRNRTTEMVFLGR